MTNDNHDLTPAPNATSTFPPPCRGRPIVIVTDAWTPQVNGVVRTLQTLVGQLRDRGYDVVTITPDQYKTVPLPTYAEIRLALFSWFNVGKRIRAAEPLAVHIATEGPLGLAARRFCKKHNLPFTTAFHTKFADYLNARTKIPISFGYALLRWFHGKSRGVMVATKSMTEELHDRGIRNTKPWTRGVNLSAFSPDHGQTPPEDLRDLPHPLWLYTGRVAVEKNLEAFLSMDLEGSKIIVGDGPARAGLQKKFPDARFLGPKFGTDLAAIYSAADVFVFPSRTDTFGLVVIEALASGTPVAAYPVPGPGDILADAPLAGALNDDLTLAAQKALTLLPDDARHHASQFSWDNCTDMFLANLAPISRSDLPAPKGLQIDIAACWAI